MSQLKVNAISDAAGANGNAITLASDGTCTAKITNNLSNRNLIINGAMQVAQRGTSSTTNGWGSVDRWKVNFGGLDEAVTHAQHALTSSDTGPWAKGFRYSLHLTNGNQTSGAGAGDYIEVDQYIEAQNVVQSGWDYTSASSYITLSFWIKSSVAQNFYGYLRVNDNTKQLYCIETGSLSANTWTKVTKKIPGATANNIDNNNGNGILFRLLPFYGTDMTGTRPLNAWAAYDSAARTPDSTSTWYTTNDATLEFTGFQLEVGDTATDFEHRSYADELARCQRYYYKFVEGSSFSMGVGQQYSGTNSSTNIFFPVTMRTAPGLDATSGTNYYILYGNGSSTSVNGALSKWCAGVNAAFVEGTAAADIGGGISTRWQTGNAATYVAFDSELS